ncbi:glycosyltransferase family A protein [Alkalibacter saccharofermentans]|uniref:Glycosyl transferase family 2 n=1 Tax=Alkalibacter saccharofermentans DSM 14828 TaxID=1120975 RepID=A0A1M4WQ71_9FIRM|nr:glycosyltransferase family A protein [Alkalibacter saccharofermentans]SHE83358.1 Glycosyl transferase family 2 [Alkalibacter saccharofermentans DSM 14828]
MNIRGEMPLVSIITPCYNGEKYVHRFLESVLMQTYSNIELIFINDGSTDKTEEIVLSYKNKFEINNIVFKYIYQENRGQAAALNQGLRIFNGKYLTWPDSDDILHKDNIKLKVEYLESNQDYGMVLCKSRVIDEDTLKPIGELRRIHDNVSQDNLFRDLILEKNVYYAPGGYMVRTSSLDDVVENREIYESRAGQNWQLLLPIASKYRCGYIDKHLYDYLVRSNSHSRMENDYKSEIQKCNNHEDVIINTIHRIHNFDDYEKKKWCMVVNHKYLKKKFEIASKYRITNDMTNGYLLLKELNLITFKDIILYNKSKYSILFHLYELVKFGREKIQGGR